MDVEIGIRNAWKYFNTTYREWSHRVSGTHMILGQRPEGICNYGSCPHGGGGGDANREQGRIQLATEFGMRIGMCRTTAEQSEKH